VSEESLDAILEKLCSGDPESAEKVFRAYEPFLRSVVRRQLSPQLRAKFDSADVVQSVWADLLQGFRDGDWSFPDREHLKAFLVTATRHRFLDLVRHHRSALKHEEAPGGARADAASMPCPHPRPSQIVQADDLWKRILAECQPAHREVLKLKREGLAVTEIAARTGMHEGSIHRILRNLASRLALSP
jgi:RNA polymerase sigma-70 factor (ECF subfamily)